MFFFYGSDFVYQQISCDVFISGPWDLEVATNAVVFERSPLNWPHPHPDIESYRATLVVKLRQAYQEMCHSREGV